MSVGSPCPTCGGGNPLDGDNPVCRCGSTWATRPRKPLTRRTPLAPGSKGLAPGKGLTRGAPLAGGAPLARSAPAARPRKPRVAPEVRDAVLARSRGLCEANIAMVCLGRATNLHHRRRRNIGPDPHTVWNLLHLCGSGSTGCHGWITEHPEASRAEGVGWIVSVDADPATTPVLLRGRLLWLTANGGTVERLEVP